MNGTRAGRRRAPTRTRRILGTHASLPARALLTVLAVLGVAAVVATVLLWPGRSALHELQGKANFAEPGTTYVTGRIDEIGGQDARVTLLDGPEKGSQVRVPMSAGDRQSSLGPGDRVSLNRSPTTGSAKPTYGFFAVERGTSLWILSGIFAVILIAVARWRGVMALVGLAVAGAMMWWFVLPALLVGHSAPLVALVGCAVILYVVLYSTHGFRPTTSAALAGTLCGVAITVLLASWSIDLTRLSGVSGDAGNVLSGFDSGMRFPGLLAAAIVVAGLGVLNDVTITQASAVYELRAASPGIGRLALWRAAMRIGRDHIASTVYTIVFAYGGAALTTLLVVQLYDQPARLLLSTEDLAEEIVRTMVSSIGLILAVPITTAIATLVADGSEPGHSHPH